MGLKNDAILLLCPRGFLHLRVKVVVPTLPALLPQPPFQVLGYQGPLLGAIFFNQFNYLWREWEGKDME